MSYDDEYSGPKTNPQAAAEARRIEEAMREGEAQAWVARVVRGAKALWGFLTFQGKDRP